MDLPRPTYCDVQSNLLVHPPPFFVFFQRGGGGCWEAVAGGTLELTSCMASFCMIVQRLTVFGFVQERSLVS